MGGLDQIEFYKRMRDVAIEYARKSDFLSKNALDTTNHTDAHVFSIKSSVFKEVSDRIIAEIKAVGYDI